MTTAGDTLEAQLDRYQRRFRVMRGVLLGTRPQDSLDVTLSAFVEAVCDGFGWPVGLYFAHSGGTGTFAPTEIRFAARGSAPALLRALAERSRQDSAVAFDAEIVRTGAPRWVPNVTLEPSFEAAKQAVALGVRGLVAVPITAGKRLYGIAEFFTRDEFNPSTDQVEYLADLGHIVGAAVHFHGMDRRLQKIRRGQEFVFSRLRDPVYIVDRDGRATFANGPAAALFGLSTPEELVGTDIHRRYHMAGGDASAVPATECPLHGVPTRTHSGTRRRERFRTESRSSVEVEAIAAPFVIDGTEETVIVLRIP